MRVTWHVLQAIQLNIGKWRKVVAVFQYKLELAADGVDCMEVLFRANFQMLVKNDANICLIYIRTFLLKKKMTWKCMDFLPL